MAPAHLHSMQKGISNRSFAWTAHRGVPRSIFQNSRKQKTNGIFSFDSNFFPWKNFLIFVSIFDLFFVSISILFILSILEKNIGFLPSCAQWYKLQILVSMFSSKLCPEVHDRCRKKRSRDSFSRFSKRLSVRSSLAEIENSDWSGNGGGLCAIKRRIFQNWKKVAKSYAELFSIKNF